MWLELEWPRHVPEAMRRNGGSMNIVVLGRGSVAPFFVGVSGYDEEDCFDLVREALFAGDPMPEIRNRVADVDVSTLPEELLGRLGNPAARGVWYPPLQ